MRTLQAPLIHILLVDELRELFVSWLGYEDKVWLWICALEWELDDVARYLRYEATDSTFPKEDALMEMALGCGCFNVVWHILEKTQVDEKRPASSVKWMEWLEDHHPRMYSGHVMERAAARGDLALVEWLHSTCEYNTHGAVSAAASQGHLEVAQWLLDHRVSSDTKQWLADQLISSKPVIHGRMPQDNIHVNVRLGTLGLMMWTVNGSVPFFCVRDPKARKGVVFVNGSDVVKSSGSLISKPDALVFAVHIGDLDLLQRISEDKDASRDTNIPKAATLAARLGRLDILQWLYTQRVGNLPVQALYEAARSGRLDVIEWVIACGRTESFDPDILLLAGVASASQQVVEWICDLFPVTRLTTEPSRLSKSAAAVAYWEDLKDTKVVEVLEWLCVNDRAQPSWWLIEMACRAGKLSFLRDLIKDVHVDEMMASSLIQGLNEACLRGHLEVVVYLTEEMGMLCREGFESAMSQGHRGVAEYLLRMNPQHCPPLSSTTALRMVYDGHVDLVEWEYSTGRMQCLDGMWRCEVERVFRTESLRDSISRYRSVEVNDLRRMRVVAQWLLSHETFGADMVYFVARWAAQRCQTDLFRLAITTIKSRYLYCATYPKWRLPFDIGRLLDLVIEYTTLGDIAQMLLELYPPAISPRVIQWAIECEQTEILQRWGEKVPPPTLAIPPTSPRKVVYRRREEDQSDRITTRVAVCVAVWGVVGYFVYSA